MNEFVCRIFAMVGIAGSILCALGDYFLYRCNGTDSVRIVNSVWVWIVIISGVLNVPKPFCLLTPLSLLLIGTLLSKVSRVFKTFPLALTNTLGLGGMAVIALFCSWQ